MNHDTYYQSFLFEGDAYISSGVLDFFNKRIRVDMYRGNIVTMLRQIEEIAAIHDFEKIIIKVRNEHVCIFAERAYTIEATIAEYFEGSKMLFMTKYRKDERRNSNHWLVGDDILYDIKKKEKNRPDELTDYVLREATRADATSLANLYKEVFQLYPTPLHDFSYIESEMTETIFYVAEHNEQIVSVASAEMNRADFNAELTNCATLPAHRKVGIMKNLLSKLEEGLINRHMYCAYTIARSLSFGMNCAFYQLGYTYTGRLTNNCYIYDKLEDMNVWVKNLAYVKG
jgi:beta-lysine N6-acetyltransferase